jgi:hypothetical protein
MFYKKKYDSMVSEIQVMAWDRHKNMAELNQLIGS